MVKNSDTNANNSNSTSILKTNLTPGTFEFLNNILYRALDLDLISNEQIENLLNDDVNSTQDSKFCI